MKKIRTIRFKDEDQVLRHLIDDVSKIEQPDVVFREARKAEKEAIRILVTEMIVYAERLPYEKNVRAEAIKEALSAQIVNGVIPHDILDDDLKSHLNNLGNAYDKKAKECAELRKENCELKQRLENIGKEHASSNDTMNFNHSVGTVIARADHVTLHI